MLGGGCARNTRRRAPAHRNDPVTPPRPRLSICSSPSLERETGTDHARQVDPPCKVPALQAPVGSGLSRPLFPRRESPYDRKTPASCADPDDPAVPPSCPEDSLLSPPRSVLPGWGLAPLLHSVRSKLESFAEIFLTPIQSPFTHGGEEAGGRVRGEDLEQAQGTRITTAPVALVTAEGEDSQAPELAMTRPSLQRCLSCPSLPVALPLSRRSLGTKQKGREGATLTPRRHSLGSVEEIRHRPPTFTCLRKERHPLLLSQDSRSVPSERPPSQCLDEDGAQGWGLRVSDERVAEDPPLPEVKHPATSCATRNKVSNIQIRKRSTRQGGNLTPMGLPKRARLHKEDFSLEEIYTNKNYHTPTEKRKFETIFEEPVMRGGALVLTGQRPLRRVMVFKDGSAAQRKRRRKGKGAARGRRCTTVDHVDAELLLQHKMSQLEAD